MSDYELLSGTGNIGFYKSCEVTQYFLMNNTDKSIANFFILVAFEETDFTGRQHQFLGNRIQFSPSLKIGIQQYRISLEEAKNNFELLVKDNKWNYDGDTKLKNDTLRLLPKQYIPAKEGNTINNILKNNFDSGSYLIEFFDEKKTHLTDILDYNNRLKFEKICEQIKKEIPLDFSVLRDRVGNIVFQFPITILDANSKALSDWNGTKLFFAWHGRISTPPDCTINVFSEFDKNLMGSALVPYNKLKTQDVITGSLDLTTNIHVRRNNPDLVLSTFTGTYLRSFSTNMGIVNPEPRIFELNEKLVTVQVSSHQKMETGKQTPTYSRKINARLYSEEKQSLERLLSFKQYGIGSNQHSEAILDLRQLIQRNDGAGIYLWDPFLTPNDIFQTLYFSQTAHTPIKAIGAINKTVISVYGYKSKKPLTKWRAIFNLLFNIETKEKDENLIPKIISKYYSQFANPNNNNYALNLEFRCQHSIYGWQFHDRFLIFPPSTDKPPKAYSLGTSINSYGNDHHILQELSHPQRVVDAFDELWNKLNTPECIVWKSR